MRKKYIYIIILLQVLIPALLYLGITLYSNLFDESCKTWYCKENNMYITIVNKSNENDLIILNMTDTIFISDDLGESLYGVELHFKPNNDTIQIPCNYLTISKIKAKKYTIIPTKLKNVEAFTIPILLNNTDITVSGDPDRWDFYTLKNGEYADDILEVVN